MAFELRLDRLPPFGHGPHVLGPTVTFLSAECATQQPGPEQVQSFGTALDPHLIAQRLAWPRRAGRIEAVITRVAFVLGISTVSHHFDLRGDSFLPLWKYFRRA
jgi:hypothetical protein